MHRPILNLLLVIVMLFALSFASPASATASTDEPVVPGDREAPAYLEEVPAEIQALFEEGMTAEEFVRQAGYMPKALEDLVEGEALMIIEMERDPLAVIYAEQKVAGVSAASVSRDLYRNSLTDAQAALEPALAKMGVTVISHYTAVYNGMQVLVPYSKLNELRELPGVKAVHVAPIVEPDLSASVPLIGADDVWEDLGVDGEGVTIVVIDTGIDYTHAAFGGAGTASAYSGNNPDVVESGSFPTTKVVDGRDFAGTNYDASGTYGSTTPVPDADPLDEAGHGTHVASIAAGIAAGAVMTGVAPAANLIALKIFGASGSTSLTIDALEWATQKYIDASGSMPMVINMSLGSDFGTGDSGDLLINATQTAAEVGIVVVASAGNSGNTSYITGAPAVAARAISVAASSNTNTIESFSSRGPRGVDSYLKPEITAPGVGIVAAARGTGTGAATMSGTSMASPHAAGVAALVLAAHPDWTPERTKAAMMNTAVSLADGAPIPRSGAGRVDAYRAVGTSAVAVGDPELVSLSWGVISSADDAVTTTKTVTLTNLDSSPVTYDAACAFQAGSLTAGAGMTISPTTATVLPNSCAVFDVALTLDMATISAGTSFSRTVEEYYGFVTFTPQGGGAADALRVPFYFQPRPYSVLSLVADDTISQPATDVKVITMTHTGPISSSTWLYPALAYSGTPDTNMAGPGDVRLFGMDYGWTDSTYGDMVTVAIDAWGAWHVPQAYFTEFDLYLDVNEDGTDDYRIFNYDYGYATGGDASNVWIVLQRKLSDNTLTLASPYAIYTDYNASFMQYYLDVSRQLSTGDTGFDYELRGADADGSRIAATGSFDYAKYPFSFANVGTPGPAGRSASANFAIHDLDGYNLSDPVGLMLVDYSGDPANADGSQAYFLPVEVVPTVVEAPAIVAVDPVDGAVNVAADADVVITFTNAIDTATFVYSVSPDPGGWTETWSGEDSVVSLSHNAFARRVTYTITIIAGEDQAGNVLDASAWTFRTVGYPNSVYLPLMMRVVP